MDPLARGLSSPERSRRTLAAWKQAIATISSCARQKGLSVVQNAGPQSPLLISYSNLAALRPEMRAGRRIDNEVIENALARISAAEDATASVCGELSPPDLALQLIAKAHGINSE
jgi:hypothetical protein